jgi:hypothetical protein
VFGPETRDPDPEKEAVTVVKGLNGEKLRELARAGAEVTLKRLRAEIALQCALHPDVRLVAESG